MDSYEISYNFTVNECSDGEHSVTVMITDGSKRIYTIKNSSNTSVEEDSTYSISLTAVNRVARSTPTSIPSTVTTKTAGIDATSFNLAFDMYLSSHAAPTGYPQSLMNTSTTISNITLQWAKVKCEQRNGHIDKYLISYELDNKLIQENTSDLMFTITGLQPSTTHNFTVEALGIKGHDSNPNASISIVTEAPQSMHIYLYLYFDFIDVL